MAQMKITLRCVVDHKRLAKLMRKAIAKIEAVPEEQRVEAVSEWAARIVHDCVGFEIADDVQHVSKDS